eukprot:COSAG01_NODE_625_length_14726_cov_9.023997_11_plen_145_part_00
MLWGRVDAPNLSLLPSKGVQRVDGLTSAELWGHYKTVGIPVVATGTIHTTSPSSSLPNVCTRTVAAAAVAAGESAGRRDFVRACVRAGGRAGGRAAGVLDDIVDSGVWAPGSLAERRGSHRRVGIDLSIEHRSARFRQVVCVQL